MRLTELKPRWLHFGGGPIAIMFLCPHCVSEGKRETWLTCFFVAAGTLPAVISEDEDLNGERGERLLFEEEFIAMGEPNPRRKAWDVVSCNPDKAWVRTSDDFETMSITPSLDASAAGHWHGHISKGLIT